MMLGLREGGASSGYYLWAARCGAHVNRAGSGAAADSRLGAESGAVTAIEEEDVAATRARDGSGVRVWGPGDSQT